MDRADFGMRVAIENSFFVLHVGPDLLSERLSSLEVGMSWKIFTTWHYLFVARLMGQYYFAGWRLSSSVTLPAAEGMGMLPAVGAGRSLGAWKVVALAAGRMGGPAADTAWRAGRVTCR